MIEFLPTLIGCIVAGSFGAFFGAVIASAPRAELEVECGELKHKLRIATMALYQIRDIGEQFHDSTDAIYAAHCSRALERIGE